MSVFWMDEKRKEKFPSRRESEDVKLESMAVVFLSGVVFAIGLVAMFFVLFLS